MDELSDPETLRERFDDLVRWWQRDTMLLSSSTAIINHAAYRQIIGIGDPAVPLILQEMSAGHLHWSAALAEITGANPAAGTKSPRAATEAWLRWGNDRDRGVRSQA